MVNESIIFENFVPSVTQYCSIVNESLFSFGKGDKEQKKVANLIYSNENFSITATENEKTVVFSLIKDNEVFYVWVSKINGYVSVMFSNVMGNVYGIPKCNTRGEGLPMIIFDRNGLKAMVEYNNRHNKCKFRDEIVLLCEIHKYCREKGNIELK